MIYKRYLFKFLSEYLIFCVACPLPVSHPAFLSTMKSQKRLRIELHFSENFEHLSSQVVETWILR